jgi:uncharacterized membrane protein
MDQKPSHNRQATSQPSTVEAISNLTQRNIDLIDQLEEAADRQRGAGEHVADVITRLAGSVPFVYWHLAWFGLWIAFNTLPVVPDSLHFDPYPFTFLTFVVSLEAIFLSTFILISQNHENQLAQQRSHLDLQINLLSEQENSRMLSALARIEEKLGIPVEPDITTLQQEIRADQLSEQIDQAQAKPTANPGQNGRIN